MRAGTPLLLLLALLPGCKEKEPDFDTQYNKTAKEIEARAKKLDASMDQQMQAMDREMEVRGFATPAAATTNVETPAAGSAAK